MEAFNTLYDSFLACCVYESWREAPEGKSKEVLLSELLMQLAPLATIVAIDTCNPNIGDENIYILKSEALEYVFFVLKQEYIPEYITRNTGTFTGYFWTTIKRGIIKSYHASYEDSVFDYAEAGTTPPTARLDRHEDADIRLYMNKFYRLVLSAAINDIRFVGNERKACVFMCKCILGLLEFHPLSARVRYKIPKSRAMFLLQYTEHVIKQAMITVEQIDEGIAAQRTA